MVEEELRKCSRCEESKPTSEFKRVRRNKSGYLGYCKDCDPQRDPIFRKYKSIWMNYGLSQDDYDGLRFSQNFKCAICDKHETEAPRGTLFVDHCHATGKVRKLLCSNCNAGLGQFKDDPELLTRAHQYLKDHKQWLH